MESVLRAYWRMFRLIFVIFFLYLLADGFYRWDGFRHYATFFEFIPGIALISILWTIVAALATILMLVLTESIEKLSSFAGRKIDAEYILMFCLFVFLIGKLVWISKKAFWGGGSTFLVKIIVIISVIVLSIFVTCLFRKKLSVIQERLTPLIILFGIIVLVSFPVVIYHTWLKDSYKTDLKQTFQSAAVEKDQPNILLVTFDALTALDMSVYGYHRKTTPFIKKWAKDAVLFKKAYAAGTTTATTTASLMTGKRLWSHLKYIPIHEGNVFRGETENIALEMKKHGYFTFAVTANANAEINSLGMQKSFDYYTRWTDLYRPGNLSEYTRRWLYNLFGEKIRLYEWLVMHDFGFNRILRLIPVSKSNLPFPLETTVKRFFRVIDYKMREPFFAWVHFLPPHAPYAPPEPFIGMFNDSSLLTNKRQQDKIFSQNVKNELDTESKKELFQILRDRYDENIRYCDKTFESMYYQLKKRKILRNTVIIFSSDHGESFEHDMLEHAGILYEQVTHIPLIIREPNMTTGRVVDIAVEQIDIPATILELAHVSLPEWMEGRSLVPLMHGEMSDSRQVFSMYLSPNISGQKITKGKIATWKKAYKLIHYLEKEKTLLFNLEEDPKELVNLIVKEPEKGQRLLGLIRTNLEKANNRIRLFD